MKNATVPTVFRMVRIICVLNEPITVQGRQGMEEIDF